MTKFVGLPVSVVIAARDVERLVDVTVPDDELWRPQFYVLERLGGTDTVVASIIIHPPEADDSYTIQEFEFAGEKLHQQPAISVWGPGDRIVIDAWAPAGGVSLKFLAGIVIDEKVTRDVAAPKEI